MWTLMVRMIRGGEGEIGKGSDGEDGEGESEDTVKGRTVRARTAKTVGVEVLTSSASTYLHVRRTSGLLVWAIFLNRSGDSPGSDQYLERRPRTRAIYIL